MAGSPIATLFARLGFQVDKKGLQAFEGHLQTLRRDINKMGTAQAATSKQYTKGVNQSARATQNLTKDTEKLQSRLDGILRSYGKVPVSLDRARKDMQAVRGMFSDGDIDRAQLASAQARIQQRIDTLVQADNKRTQRVLGNISKEQQGLKRIRNDYSEINREYRRGNVSYERRAELLGGLRQEYRRQQQFIKPEHKRANLLEQIEKRYDRHGKQLRQIRRDFSYVNTQYKSGNISLERRNELLGDQYRRYRDIQRIERRQRATGSRVGRAGGIYAGGADPRQVGNHRLISALHSDVGLGTMVAGFGAVQSSLAYQNYVAMEQGLVAVTGSAEEAGKQFEYLHSVSDKLGVNITSLGSAYTQFAAAMKGSDLQTGEMQETFEGFVSYARVLNLSAADMDGVFRSVIQMANKGQIMAEELDSRLAAQ
ncbi:MAG: hypothetical protein CMH22_04840 [Methylophaga sp.]|nr:hypothetical protein [Methylophaga sp.]|tara:strand:+ start:58145 stop:59422 length:1278 start_codon:yes stop_codon:yes gene_type:complete